MKYVIQLLVFIVLIGIGTVEAAALGSVTADEYMAMTSYHNCRLELYCLETKSGKESNRIYQPSEDFLEIPFTQETCRIMRNDRMGTPPEDRCSDGT